MLFDANQRSALLGLYLLTWSLPASAAEDENENPSSDLPNLELLEFLGQFETDQGNWIAPSELMMDEFENLLDAAINEESEPAVDGTDTGNNN